MKRVLLLLIIFLTIAPGLVRAETSEKQAVAFPPAVFLEGIKLQEGSFGDKVRTTVSTFLVHTENWRKDAKVSLGAALEKVKAARVAHPDDPPHVKAMTFIHMWVLMIVGFVFGVSFIFYTVAIIIAIFVLKRIFRIIVALFRRRADN
jgi:hypothetical protein